MLRSNISDIFSHKYTKTKINSDDDLPLEKTLNILNVTILIKPIVNKNLIIITMKHLKKNYIIYKMQYYERIDVAILIKSTEIFLEKNSYNT